MASSGNASSRGPRIPPVHAPISMTARSNLKVLSLDGGGVRGLSTLMILEEFFRRLNAKRRQDDPNATDIEPYDYFDLIGGTSTGGIIALMLGRLRMNIKQCKEAYLKLAAEAFVPKKGFFREDRFDARKFENVVIKVIRRHLTSDEGVAGREDAPLLDPRGSECCKTIAYTLSYVNTNPTQAIALRTYRSDATARPFTIWQAVRATSAAPTFFEPLILTSDGNSKWVDGGLNVNNPADQILQEVKLLWGEESHRFELERIGLFLSIGTGIGENVSLKGGFRNDILTRFGAPETFIKGMVKFTFDCEGPNQRLQKIFGESFQTDKAYHRFNPTNNLRDIRFFEFKRMEEVQACTQSYLNSEVTIRDLNRLVLQARDATYDPRATGSPRFLSTHDLSALVELQKNDPEILKLVEPYDAPKYFNHLTVKGMEVYMAVWARLSKDSENYITFDSFAAEICRFGPTIEKLEEIWTRLRGGRDARLPRNMMLCVLYMLHVECFDPRYREHRPLASKDGPVGLTDQRFEIAKAFGNWVECRFHQGAKWCGRRWSYANNHVGMCREGDSDAECDLWRFYEARLRSYDTWSEAKGFHKATAYPGDHEIGRRYRMQCREKFMEHKELSK